MVRVLRRDKPSMRFFHVDTDFTDKNTRQIYRAGEIYKTDSEKRIKELRALGFIGIEFVPKEEPKPKKTRGKGKNEDKKQ